MGAVLDTTDLEVAQHELSRLYGSVRLRASGEPHHLRLTVDQVGPVRLTRVTYGIKLEAEVAPPGALMVGRVVSGHAIVGAGRRRTGYGPGDGYLVGQPDAAFDVAVEDLDTDFAALSKVLVAGLAESGPGRAAPPVRFTGYQPESAGAARFWDDTYTFVRQLAGTPAADEPLVAGSAARLLAAAALSTFPNTSVTDPTVQDRHDAHPVTLRRAVAFIEDNAGHDISPADVAAAAFVSVRAVQLAFRRHLGLSPMAYLRRVRLHQAHRALLGADPAQETVSAVAARWGFTNHSRFAMHYRAAFGVASSETLRRG